MATLNQPYGRSGNRRADRSKSAYLMHLLRISLGITQAQLAEATGITISSITRWEAGSRVPWTVARRQLATVLACPFLRDWDTTLVEGNDRQEAILEAWVEEFRKTQKKGKR